VRREPSTQDEETEDTDEEEEMQSYFNSLNDGSGLSETENAVTRTIVDILGGSTNVTVQDNFLFNKAFCQMVFDRIPEEYRDSVPKTQASTSKFYKKFLEAKNNYIRLYLGYSKSGLENMLVSKGITSKKKTVDLMIETLASYHERGLSVHNETPSYEEHDQKATIKNILERSFQQRLKGESREYCSLGHTLELPILKAFVQEVHDAQQESSWHPLNGLRLFSGYSCGLVAKAGSPYAKDSVDFLLTVGDDDEDVTDVWAMEVKSRVTVG
jgi:hypothetical protein